MIRAFALGRADTCPYFPAPVNGRDGDSTAGLPRGESRRFRHASEVGGGCARRVNTGSIGELCRCLVGGK